MAGSPGSYQSQGPPCQTWGGGGGARILILNPFSLSSLLLLTLIHKDKEHKATRKTGRNNTPCFSHTDGLFHNRAGESKHLSFLQYLSIILIRISKKDTEKEKLSQTAQVQVPPELSVV